MQSGSFNPLEPDRLGVNDVIDLARNARCLRGWPNSPSPTPVGQRGRLPPITSLPMAGGRGDGARTAIDFSSRPTAFLDPSSVAIDRVTIGNRSTHAALRPPETNVTADPPLAYAYLFG